MPLGRAAETLLVGIVPALADIWTFALPRVRLLFYVTLHLVLKLHCEAIFGTFSLEISLLNFEEFRKIRHGFWG